jgi:FAD-linked oxidoreductase
MDIKNLKLTRRHALKVAGSGFVAGAVGTTAGCSSAPEKSVGPQPINGVLPWSNWSGNQVSYPVERARPRNIEGLVKLLKETDGKIRAVGAGHSFSGLVPTNETLLSMARFRGISNINLETKEVTAGAGTRLAALGDELWENKLGMINMPDINTQALAGAIATSTHGTGQQFGSLSSFVTGLTLVTAAGEVLKCSATENKDVFDAARCNVGSLGIITDITMQMRDAYYLKERSEMLPIDEAFEKMEELRLAKRHFEAYGLPHANHVLLIEFEEVSKEESDAKQGEAVSGDAYETFRTLADVIDMMPFLRGAVMSIAPRTVGVEERYGPWNEIFGNVRDMRFNEMEYTVPAEDGLACFREVLETIKEKDIDVIFPIEYRYIKEDDIWLSQFYKRPGAAISVHNFHDKPYMPYFAEMEAIFDRYQGRPHWGKVHSKTEQEFAGLYPKWEEFKSLRQRLDPNRRFINEHLETIFPASS